MREELPAHHYVWRPQEGVWGPGRQGRSLSALSGCSCDAERLLRGAVPVRHCPLSSSHYPTCGDKSSKYFDEVLETMLTSKKYPEQRGAAYEPMRVSCLVRGINTLREYFAL